MSLGSVGRAASVIGVTYKPDMGRRFVDFAEETLLPAVLASAGVGQQPDVSISLIPDYMMPRGIGATFAYGWAQGNLREMVDPADADATLGVLAVALTSGLLIQAFRGGRTPQLAPDRRAEAIARVSMAVLMFIHEALHRGGNPATADVAADDLAETKSEPRLDIAYEAWTEAAARLHYPDVVVRSGLSAVDEQLLAFDVENPTVGESGVGGYPGTADFALAWARGLASRTNDDPLTILDPLVLGRGRRKVVVETLQRYLEKRGVATAADEAVLLMDRLLPTIDAIDDGRVVLARMGTAISEEQSNQAADVLRAAGVRMAMAMVDEIDELVTSGRSLGDHDPISDPDLTRLIDLSYFGARIGDASTRFLAEQLFGGPSGIAMLLGGFGPGEPDDETVEDYSPSPVDADHSAAPLATTPRPPSFAERWNQWWGSLRAPWHQPRDPRAGDREL